MDAVGSENVDGMDFTKNYLYDNIKTLDIKKTAKAKTGTTGKSLICVRACMYDVCMEFSFKRSRTGFDCVDGKIWLEYVHFLSLYA